MLVNPRFRVLTDKQKAILREHGVDPEAYKPTVLIEGVFIPSVQFNGQCDIDWPRGIDTYDREFPKIGAMYTAYGVCDHYQQVLDLYPELVTSDRRFCIAVSCVRKDEEEPGGWRWHKWGPYIGTQEPTTEYIYDEPVIERVWCFHVYELSDKDI